MEIPHENKGMKAVIASVSEAIQTYTPLSYLAQAGDRVTFEVQRLI
jgi:plastocyanin